MASDLYTFDHCFFSDPFSPFSDHNEIFPAFDDNNLNISNAITSNNNLNISNAITSNNNLNISNAITSNNNHNISNAITSNNNDGGNIAAAAVKEVKSSDDDETVTLEQIANVLLAPSPACDRFENLFAGGVKGEEFQAPFNGGGGAVAGSFAVAPPQQPENAVRMMQKSYSSNSFAVAPLQQPENAARMMQRSYSSNCFDGKPAGIFYRPGFDSRLDQSPTFHQPQAVNPFQTDFSSATQIRRVCSTGDLHVKTGQNRTVLPSSPEGMEEPYFRVGKYTPAERREKIFRYRVKRHQRNFSKTIKYACRKTLADNRPRIRGRFARNDEVETPKAATSSSSTMFHRHGQYQDQHVWVGDAEGSSSARSIGGEKAIFNTFGSAPNFQYYSSY